MNRYRKILVSLNLSDMDPVVLRYANLIAELTQPDRVELVNVVNTRHLPKDVVAEYPELVDAAVQSNSKALRELADKYLQPSPSCDVQVHVFSGVPAHELVRYAKSQETDLLLVGRDPKNDRAGTLPERLAREAPCSVVVVPRGSKPAIRSILVPVDFSEHSATAVERAVLFAQTADVSAVTCLHTYDIPGQYRKTGMAYEEFAEIMKKHAEEAWEKFRQKIDSDGIELKPIIRRAAFPSQAIKDEVAQSGFDFVIMGARGRSASRNLMLGSVSQRVINATTVPLLAVKSKRESAGFMDILHEIFGRSKS